MKAQVIFNPASGNPVESAAQLLELLRYLQAEDIQSEVLLVHPEIKLHAVARNAVREGFKMVIVSGGDGTIENVALGLVGSRATLGIIPTGTRNNLARSLGIPTNDIPSAVALLRKGRRIKIDVGHIRVRQTSRYFLEAGAVGLASALYPAADDIQHGDLGKIAEFISTFVSHAPSDIRLRLDNRRSEVITQAHMVLVANTPYMGANFHIAPDVAFADGKLDIFVYSNLSKLDLIGHAIQLTAGASDSRIEHLRAKTVLITANPPMAVMADGVSLGEGPVMVTVQPRSLTVMAGLAPIPEAPPAAAPVSEPEAEPTA
jgi:YegS/Rv2252/BmrU family lipid kinase